MRRPSRILDRYILRQLAAALVAVTVGLVLLIWLTQSLRFVELVVNRGLTLRTFLELTGLLIPNFVAVILPITTFMVVQFVYQRLAGDRELTVMRAAGLSPWALSRPALTLALLAMATCYLLNLWIVPGSFGAFRQYQFEIRNRVAAFLLQEGVFTPLSEDLTVYVRSRDADGTLRGILVDDGRNKAAHATILAERGRLLTIGTPRVLLYNGTRQEIDHQSGRLNVLSFSQNTIDLSQSDRTDEQRFRDATEMSIGELLDPPPGLVSDRDRGKLLAEAHRRLTSPITAVGFTLVALVSVLTGGFQRRGGILRPFGAVLAIVALLAAGLLTINLAQRQPELTPLIWIQALAPVLAAGWLLFGPRTSAVPPPSVVAAGVAGMG